MVAHATTYKFPGCFEDLARSYKVSVALVHIYIYIYCSRFTNIVGGYQFRVYCRSLKNL